jgi:hypothetical protein
VHIGTISRPSGRRINVLLLAALLAMLSAPMSDVGASREAWPPCERASTHWDARQKLVINVCGPGRVVRGANYSYTVVLTNIGQTRHRKLALSIIYPDTLTRTSVPPQRRARNEIDGWPSAVWTLRDFKPGKVFRLGVRMPFKQHNDPLGSNFVVDVRAPGSNVAYNDSTNDVYFE